MLDEKNINIYLQQFKNLNMPMILLSKPFNSNIFYIILILCKLLNILSNYDLTYILFSGVLITILKLIVGRTRPYKTTNNIKNLSSKTHNNLFSIYSFPSGHTFIATIVCGVLFTKFSKKIYFLKIVPLLVALSRIYLGVHYTSDVFCGLFLGYLFNNYIYTKHV